MELECMICAESDNIGPLYKPCHCNTVIHEECLTRLVVVSSHQQQCPVCLKEYDIKITSKKNLYDCERQGLIFFILSYLLSVSISILFITLILYYLSNFYVLISLSIIGAISSFTPIIFIHCFYYKRTRKLCCITKILKLEREINLSPSCNVSNQNQIIQVV